MAPEATPIPVNVKKQGDKPRIGLIARADNSGLGVQTHEFYRHVQPAKTMIVDISFLNKKACHAERYGKEAMIIEGFPTKENIDNFLSDLDVVFTCETPYNYYLFARAKQLGIKSVLQYNFEFLDYLNQPGLPTPDALFAPSPWFIQNVRDFMHPTPVEYVPVPVDTAKLKFTLRREAKTFIHIAGTPAHLDRNGTAIVLGALSHVKNQAHFIFYAQKEIFPKVAFPNPKISVEYREIDFLDYTELYKDGDVQLMPRKFGGLCLPFNEASAVGMPTIMPDISPNSELLPPAALVQPTGYMETRTRTTIPVHEVAPQDLAAKIDELIETPALVQFLSVEARRYAEKISWDGMLGAYLEEFNRLCRS